MFAFEYTNTSQIEITTAYAVTGEFLSLNFNQNGFDYTVACILYAANKKREKENSKHISDNGTRKTNERDPHALLVIINETNAS